MKKILLIIAIVFCIFQMVVLAVAIDIGSPAIDRSGHGDPNWTDINKDNPANATGKITSIEVYAVSGYPLYNFEVATFFNVFGNYFSTRDTEYIGYVVSGVKQTFTVDLDVQEGDYLGCHFKDGYIERNASGYDGIWAGGGDGIPCTSAPFNFYSGQTVSLYGTGATVGWTHKWDTKTISKWNTKEFTKWNGLE